MIWIYRRRNSTSARDLKEAITLAGTLARRTKGEALRNLNPQQDVVICWGDYFQAPQGLRTLNNEQPISKYNEIRKLTEKGVPTVQVSQTRPQVAVRPGVKPPYRIGDAFAARDLTEAQTRALLLDVQRYIAQPAPAAQPVEIWLPRRNNHVGGNDLLDENLRDPDFFSKKENITEEYRIHMFRGKSVRAGKKVQRPTRPDGRTAPHQWIRSFDAGWVIQYDNFKSTKEMRALAAKAVKALGLDFAAVDLGLKVDGSLIVLEVNRAPGIEGGTTNAYAKHILNWVAGKETEGE
jgi:hypothetical protein